MTVTETAQDRSHTTTPPLLAHQIDHDALYGVLARLTHISGVVIEHVDRNTVDVHRDLDRLREAHRAARDLLWPPPPPETVEGARPLYAHALRVGDLLYVGRNWKIIESVLPGRVPRPDVHVTLDGTDGTLAFAADELLIVVRKDAAA